MPNFLSFLSSSLSIFTFCDEARKEIPVGSFWGVRPRTACIPSASQCLFYQRQPGCPGHAHLHTCTHTRTRTHTCRYLGAWLVLSMQIQPWEGTLDLRAHRLFWWKTQFSLRAETQELQTCCMTDPKPWTWAQVSVPVDTASYVLPDGTAHTLVSSSLLNLSLNKL